ADSVLAAYIPAPLWSNIQSKPSSFAPSAHTHPPSELSQSGATNGQVIKWNGSEWAPGADNTGGGGSADSTIFPTGFRVDTAKTNIRGEIAGVAAGAVDTNVYATRAWAETTFPYFFNVKSYGAKGDGKYLYDLRTTNGSATVTSASAGFVATDTGKRFFIRFGGPGGLDFFSTITTVNSATSVTLAHTLSATLTG